MNNKPLEQQGQKPVLKRSLPYKRIAGVFLLGLFFIAGYGAGSGSAKATFSGQSSVDAALANFDPYWQVWGELEKRFVPAKGVETEVTPQDRVWGSIKGMVRSYNDPYTVFFTPAENEIFTEEISGNFEGVGMQIGFNDDNMLSVIAPLPGSPAENAGLMSGDVITAIDGESTMDLSEYDAVAKIRGEAGTEVELQIARIEERESFTVSIIRQTIDFPIIVTEEVDNDTLLLRLSSFPQTTNELFRQELQNFEAEGYNNLILDLRGNPGGYLEAAVDVSSYFLDSGEVIVREESKDKEKIYRSKGYNVLRTQPNLVVLVDGGSASASEIVAGALGEQGRATVIGTQTFGKGSVQQLVPVTQDTSLKVTIARWLTPNSNSLSKKGLTPDIVIDLDEEEGENFNEDDLMTDSWIAEALEQF
jgi:carboxyl-terminal processing protease